MARDSLSPAQARRVLLAAQGFGRAPEPGAGRRRLVALVRRLGLLQIDSVHAITRAHYLPAFSRLGGYDRAGLDSASAQPPRALFEYWAHEASLLPVATQPLLRWRMAERHQWSYVADGAAREHQLRGEVLAALAELGPVTATQLEQRLEYEQPDEPADWGWNWSLVKRVLEALFWSGEISTAGRDPGFRRRYALTEQVLPAAVLATATPERADAIRELVAIAARALGVATAPDLRDYFRLSAADTAVAIRDLVDAGALVPVTVPGWPPTWLHRDARVPRRVEHAALLVPFDPLIFARERVQRVFGMRYRIEIYVPAPRREFGYYVLPYLRDEQLVGRVDLRADRRTGSLRVLGAWSEAGHDARPGLAGRLRELAGWLALPQVVVEAPGTLAAGLRADLSHPGTSQHDPGPSAPPPAAGPAAP